MKFERQFEVYDSSTGETTIVGQAPCFEYLCDHCKVVFICAGDEPKACPACRVPYEVDQEEVGR